MNFDENELDLDNLIGDDYYYDSDSSPYAYSRKDLRLTNFGYYPGENLPDTGFYYGVISPNNVAFNEYGDPAMVECEGGSFFVIQCGSHLHGIRMPPSKYME